MLYRYIITPYGQIRGLLIPYGNCKNEGDTKFADFLGSLDYDVVCKSTILDIKDMMEQQGLL